MSETWVALLRGINVGGKNRLAMADLRSMLGSIGLVDVRTHIQSGNVVFEVGPDSPSPADGPTLAAAIGDAVHRSASVNVSVVVCPSEEIARMASSHPDDGGTIPASHLHVLVFDGAPTRETEIDSGLDEARYAPDRWSLGPREAYVTYPNGAGRSKLTLGVFERAFGVTATARNLNTLHKIVALAERAPDTSKKF